MGATNGRLRKELVAPRGVFLTLGLGVTLLTGAMFYAQQVSRQIGVRFASCVNNSIQIDAYLDQAWRQLSEADDAEFSSVVDDTISRLKAAEQLIQAMIQPGSSSAGEYLPAEDPVLVNLLKSMQEAIVTFREQLQRSRHVEDPSSRQRYLSESHQLFHDSARFVRKVQGRTTQLITQQIRTLQRIDWFLLIGLLVFVGFTGRTVRRYTLCHRIAEESLRVSEEKYRRLFESSTDAVILLDDTRFIDCNPAALRIFGFESKEELRRKHPSDLSPPVQSDGKDSVKEANKLIAQAYRDGSCRFEWLHCRKDGVEVPCEIVLSSLVVEGRTILQALARDISNRKRAEAALRQNHAELQAIYGGMTDGLLIADIATRRFRKANRAICDMLGYSQAEIMRMSVDDIHPPEAMPKVLDAFEKMAQEEPMRVSSLPMVRKDGTIFFADLSSTRIMYRNHDCLIGFFRDISERKKAAEVLQSEQKSLRRLIKSQDQERQLIAYEIHDGLAQQLVAAIMQCQAIGNASANLPSDVFDTFQEVLRMLKQALNETRRLISGVRPPILDELGVVSAIRELVHETARPGGPEIDLRVDEELERLDAVVENSIYRIVQEGLTNACRHSGSRNVRIDLSQQNEIIRIEIRDWGVGFDPNDVDEKRYGVAGIRERVRLLGGRVRIDSKPDAGTRILVQLPREIHDATNSEEVNHDATS